MPRSIRQDTKRIKSDLERLVKVGEALVKEHKDDVIGGLKDLARFAVYGFNIHEEYRRLREEIASDPSIASAADKNKYFAEAISEGTSYLGKIIVENYVK